MAERPQPQWAGLPLPHSTADRKFYSGVSIKSDSIATGDFVEVRLLHGVRICLILSLYDDFVSKRRSYQMADVMCFAYGEDDEVYMTQREVPVKLADFHHKVYVYSLDTFRSMSRSDLSERHEKINAYYCRYAYEERTDTKTSALDWDKSFKKSRPRDLLEVAKRAIHSKLRSVKAAKAKKNRIKGQREKENSSAYEGDPISASSSATGVTSEEESSSVQGSSDNEGPVTPRKRKRHSTTTPKSHQVRTPGSRTHRVKAPIEVNPLPSRAMDTGKDVLLTPHQLARQRLHVAEVPISLPCREKEFANIYSQVESAIIENDSALLYISGTPGAGKTATVREVIAALQENVRNKELYPFKFVEINGMKIPDPAQAYSRLWETLTNERVSARHALSLLHDYFLQENPTGMSCVVLMDELDQLTTTKQEVMYNFFQWPSMPNTRLIVIAVSNTMDLPERFLAHKVASRLGLSRIAFASYTREQLNQIITSRLQSVPGMSVDAAAIDFACLKVASVSGDARRALDICRRAFELAEAELETVSDGTAVGIDDTHRQTSKPVATGRITMKIIRDAIRLMTTSPLQHYLSSLPLLGKLFLKALLACIRRSGLAENTLGDIIEDATRLCKVNSQRELDVIMSGSGLQPYAMFEMARSLSSAGIIYLENFRSERHCRVRLKVPEPELIGSMEGDAFLRRIT
jgi:origin recognition complex subunit 1